MSLSNFFMKIAGKDPNGNVKGINVNANGDLKTELTGSIAPETMPTKDFLFQIDKLDTTPTGIYTLDKNTGSLYARFGWDLRKSVDNGDTWQTVGTVTVATGVAVRELLVTKTGTLLAASGSDDGKIYRSTNEGTTWTQVFDWQGASFVLSQGWAEDPDKGIFVGEYTVTNTGHGVRLLKSTDDGQTFQVIDTKPFLGEGIRHWHFVIYDVWDKALWLGSGDNPEHCNLYKITDGQTVNFINGGTYDWKFVSVVPEKGVLYCPSDRTDAGVYDGCPSYIYNKKTNELKILDYEGSQSWYSCYNEKYRLPFWMTQVNQLTSINGYIQGYTADYFTSHEVLRVPANMGSVTVPSATTFSKDDYIFINFFSSVLNPTTVAFVRLKIVPKRKTFFNVGGAE